MSQSKCGHGFTLFAMAKIRRLGHDNHAPFQVVLVVVVLENQAVTRGKNNLPLWTPNFFTDSEPPIK